LLTISQRFASRRATTPRPYVSGIDGDMVPGRTVGDMVSRIVTYAFRRRHRPRKKKAVALAVPAIMKAPTKGERIRRREASAAADRETSPEEMEEEARAEAFLRRMMQPR
jgi:hypothetical protein